jgi:hypothetical protein
MGMMAWSSCMDVASARVLRVLELEYSEQGWGHRTDSNCEQ